MKRILVEAETFADLGGWTVETQSIEAMGAVYLLAHGIGKPVDDARSELIIPETAKWHCYVRTRNWSSVWKRGSAAGMFQFLIDGKALPQKLGTIDKDWNWEKAGEVELDQGAHSIALHDLTGFDGRCDAIYLTTDATNLPPNDRETLDKLRKELNNRGIEDDPEEYDLLVCGGGFAGVCAALTAKYKQLKIKLIQDRPVLGGCGSSEIRVWAGGRVNTPPYPELGNLAVAISPIAGKPGDKKDKRLFEDDRKELLFSPQELLLNEILIDVELDPLDKEKIIAVITRSVRNGKLSRRRARLFADCTGDAVLGRLAGCATMYGCEGNAEFGESLAPDSPNSMVMGHSTLWEVERLDHEVKFPDIDWGIEFTDDNAIARFNCCWDWETGQFKNQVLDIEQIRDYGLMTCYANWSFLKNRSKRKAEWANLDLTWLSAIGGKRESYRIIGDMILTQNDIEKAVPYEDGTGSTTWSIDLHLPDPDNQKIFEEAFQSCAYHRFFKEPYPVPYRCLYAKDVRNLFIGGRCLSLSHVAFSSVRVMRTLGMLGEVAGMAAELCVKHNCFPRDIYTTYLDELKESMQKGVEYTPPGSWLHKNVMEMYHFMRPQGSAGNMRGEDCWYRFKPDGTCDDVIPERIGDCIESLGMTHLNGKKYRKE